MASQLKNPPLIEALLEIKWDLKKMGPDAFEDPGYKLASGRLFDRIKKRFGYIQNLPINMFPEELTAYSVRNQFRAEENGWPLVQLGPGVATVNITPPYSWTKFKESIKFFIPQLFESYSGIVPGQPDYKLNINSILLRYINGIEWDWAKENTLKFLQEDLHTNFSLPEKVIEGTQDVNPVNINLQIGYPIIKPKGQVIFRFSSGIVGQEKGLVLELLFLSAGSDLPKLDDLNEFMKWVNDAHAIVERCFFALIEGQLQKQFKGD